MRGGRSNLCRAGEVGRIGVWKGGELGEEDCVGGWTLSQKDELKVDMCFIWERRQWRRRKCGCVN